MSKDLKDSGASTEQSKLGPDYFAYFTQEIQNLLSLDEGFPPFPTSIASEHLEKTLGDKKVVNGRIYREYYCFRVLFAGYWWQTFRLQERMIEVATEADCFFSFAGS